jgi:hypothetical protein
MIEVGVALLSLAFVGWRLFCCRYLAIFAAVKGQV